MVALQRFKHFLNASRIYIPRGDASTFGLGERETIKTSTNETDNDMMIQAGHIEARFQIWIPK